LSVLTKYLVAPTKPFSPRNDSTRTVFSERVDWPNKLGVVLLRDSRVINYVRCKSTVVIKSRFVIILRLGPNVILILSSTVHFGSNVHQTINDARR